jgi:hypothetical protein
MDSWKMPMVGLVVVGVLSISFAVTGLVPENITSCTAVIPGQPYYCGSPTLSRPLVLSISTALAGLAFGAVAIMMISHQNNRKTSTVAKPAAP